MIYVISPYQGDHLGYSVKFKKKKAKYSLLHASLRYQSREFLVSAEQVKSGVLHNLLQINNSSEKELKDRCLYLPGSKDIRVSQSTSKNGPFFRLKKNSKEPPLGSNESYEHQFFKIALTQLSELKCIKPGSSQGYTVKYRNPRGEMSFSESQKLEKGMKIVDVIADLVSENRKGKVALEAIVSSSLCPKKIRYLNSKSLQIIAILVPKFPDIPNRVLMVEEQQQLLNDCKRRIGRKKSVGILIPRGDVSSRDLEGTGFYIEGIEREKDSNRKEVKKIRATPVEERKVEKQNDAVDISRWGNSRHLVNSVVKAEIPKRNIESVIEEMKAVSVTIEDCKESEPHVFKEDSLIEEEWPSLSNRSQNLVETKYRQEDKRLPTFFEGLLILIFENFRFSFVFLLGVIVLVNLF